MRTIEELNKGFGNLFNLEDEDEVEGEDKDTEEPEQADAFTAKWGWLMAVDTVSETMRIDWGRTTRLPIVEFLNVLCYTRDRNAKREADMNKSKNRRVY